MNSSLHLQTLQRYVRKHDDLPSLSALSLLLDCPEHEISGIIDRLAAEGYITLCANGTLSAGPAFGLHDAPLSAHSIPAGMPTALADDLSERLNIHTYLVPAGSHTVIVPVSGESMLGAGIHDGDMAIIDLDATPQSGDVVAAEIDGQFTLKRLASDESGTYLLRAENPDYPTLRPSDSLRIHGVLVGLARRY